VLLHAYQANTLRGATRLPDFAGIDTDHFAIARDDHQIRFIGHREDGDYLSGFLRGLHVDHALAAAIGEPVIGQLRALAVSEFRNRQNEALFAHHLGADDEIAFSQIHPANAASRTAHRADLRFIEPDRMPFVRTEEDVFVSGSDAR